MTAALDTRVPPLDPGTVCMLAGQRVRAYANIWPGELWDGWYEVRADGETRSTSARRYATREQLEVLHG